MAKQKTAKKKSAPRAAAKKATPVKRPRRNTTLRPGQAAAPPIRVRMFRQGLGDCFLITFDVGGDEHHLLIDCGTLGNKAGAITIDDVAESIHETIKPAGRLHAVIATHEHQDHLSGFRNQKMQQLRGNVDHVWLAWTENPDDGDAQHLSKHKDDLVQSLAAVAAAAPNTNIGQQVGDLLGFVGDMSAGPFGFAKRVNEAMEFVRTGLGPKAKYHEPGDLIEADWLPGFRIYVLGPPRNETLLKNLGDHGSGELFGLQGAAHLQAAAEQAHQPNAEELKQFELQMPFDMRYVQHGDELKARHYPGYFLEQNSWRSVEYDWLNLASNFALQLDSLTNNTSLALAIERIADGKVLLFPADAQLGNWLSWHQPQMQWAVEDASGRIQQVTALDLLERTVFYKVGHHASHNATARGKGLELMKQEAELTAFIPVDRSLALTRNPKGSWQMPAELLYLRLLEKCQGRVARSDLGWASKPTPAQASEEAFANLANDAQWKQWGIAQQAAKHVTVGDTFIEYLLK